jgi:hypothetical protein
MLYKEDVFVTGRSSVQNVTRMSANMDADDRDKHRPSNERDFEAPSINSAITISKV